MDLDRGMGDYSCSAPPSATKGRTLIRHSARIRFDFAGVVLYPSAISLPGWRVGQHPRGILLEQVE
jgi:hypothetical protein